MNKNKKQRELDSFRMDCIIKLKTPLSDMEQHLYSVGSFEIRSNNKTYRFDFVDTEYRYADEQTVQWAGRNPDHQYEQTADITEDILRNIDEFTEFFVYYFDPDAPEIESIEEMSFTLYAGDEISTILVPDELLKTVCIYTDGD